MKSVHAGGRGSIASRWIQIALVATLLWTPLDVQAQTPARRNPAPHGALAGPATSPAAEQPKFKGVWEPVNYGQDLRLTDVYFVSLDVGYVSGAGGTILKTTDAGKTWTPQLGGDPQSQEPDIIKLRFVDRTHGWALQKIGFDSKLLRTSDGENWEQVGTLPPGWGLIDFLFTSPANGVLLDGNANSSHIFRTADGGRTWKEVFAPGACKVSVEVQGLGQQRSCIFLALHMASSAVGYAVGVINERWTEVADRIVVGKTVDGGLTWGLSVAQGPGPLFGVGIDHFGLFFTDESTGLVSALSVSATSPTFATNDGGQSWHGVPGSAGPEIRFADPEVGWAFGHLDYGYEYKLNYTADGAKHWASRTFRFPAEVTGFSLPRRDRGYVVGNHGMIYRYSVVPATYQAAAHSLDAPAMPGFNSPLFTEVATLSDVVAKLSAKLSAVAATPVQSAIQPGAEPGSQASTQGGAQAAAFQQDTTPTNPAGGATTASAFQQNTTGTNTGATSVAPGSIPGNVGAGGFQQDTGTGPVAGGYVDSCCGPLIQQLETTANSFATNVPAFSQRFRNLNLIIEGLNLVNNIVNQANTLKQSIRALRQAKNAQAASVALTTVQSQLNGISTGGGFVQDVSTPLQP